MLQCVSLCGGRGQAALASSLLLLRVSWRGNSGCRVDGRTSAKDWKPNEVLPPSEWLLLKEFHSSQQIREPSENSSCPLSTGWVTDRMLGEPWAVPVHLLELVREIQWAVSTYFSSVKQCSFHAGRILHFDFLNEAEISLSVWWQFPWGILYSSLTLTFLFNFLSLFVSLLVISNEHPLAGLSFKCLNVFLFLKGTHC